MLRGNRLTSVKGEIKKSNMNKKLFTIKMHELLKVVIMPNMVLKKKVALTPSKLFKL